MELTRNSIVDLFSENRQEHFQPIVQILDVKLLRSSRFQLVISDGEHFQQAVAVRDMIVICENNSVHAFQVVKLIDYFLNNVKGIDILFILNVEILCGLDFTIGSPERFDLINKQLVLQPESIPNEIQNVPIPKLSQQLDEIYMPIKALTALSADWLIKARVTRKFEIRSWSKPRGEGKLFSISIIDSYFDEIEAVFFNTAVDKFYDFVEEAKVYTFSNGKIKGVQRNYQKVANDYQIIFDDHAIIKETQDDDNIGFISFHFVELSQLPRHEINSVVDVCGIITEMSAKEELIGRSGEKIVKRVLNLKDHSFHSIELTLWNELASLAEFEDLDLQMKPILAAKAVKLSNFNVLSLSSQKNTTRVLINPRNIKEVETLNRWSSIDKTPHILLTPLSQRHVKKELKTIREITTECEIFENRSHEGTYSVLGFIGYLKHDDFSSLCYQACSNVKKCKKKVVEVGGFYRCESCRETFPDCTFRYIFTLGFHDSTGYLYATAFDESGISLFGMTGNQLHEFSKDPEHLDEIINRALKKEFIATLRASLNESSQASRVKYLIQKIKAVDVVQTADMLLDEIKSVIQF